MYFNYVCIFSCGKFVICLKKMPITQIPAIAQFSRLTYVALKSTAIERLNKYQIHGFRDITFTELKDPEFLEVPGRLCRATTKVSFTELYKNNSGSIVFVLPPSYGKHNSNNEAKVFLDEMLVLVRDKLDPAHKLVIFTGDYKDQRSKIN